MESVPINKFFGLKLIVKSGLEKTFLKFIHAGNYFINEKNSVTRFTYFQHGGFQKKDFPGPLFTIFKKNVRT